MAQYSGRPVFVMVAAAFRAGARFRHHLALLVKRGVCVVYEIRGLTANF
jgi:hypothetical protein